MRAFENHDVSHFSDIAREIKEEFNRKYERDWHCFVIEKGGHSITHDDGCYICLDIGDPMIVLFKQWGGNVELIQLGSLKVSCR